MSLFISLPMMKNKEKEEEIKLGTYPLIPGKVSVVIETSISGFKKLNLFGLDQIKEIRYRNSKFYFVYGPENAAGLLNSTWVHSNIEFNLEATCFIRLSLHDDKDSYIRSSYFAEPTICLEEITPEGDLMFTIR